MIELPKIDTTKVDNIHYNGDGMLGHNKPFNAIISCRELGKTTWFWRYCYKKLIRDGSTAIVFKYIQADITESWIEDQENVINKFLVEPIQFYFKKGNIADGIVDVRIGLPNLKFNEIEENTTLFFRVIAIALPIRRIKGMFLKNLKTIGFDEFIVDTRRGEKYPNDVAFKFKECYNTFQRESTGLRCFFLGNPYSLFNPFFVDWKVPTKELYAGNVWCDDTHYVECGKMTDELKNFILNRNPLYKFDDSYMAYAFDGRSINDEQLKIVPTQPKNYKLMYVFYIERKYLMIYENSHYTLGDDWFWIDIKDDYDNNNRLAMCFDYNDLITNTYLLSREDKIAFNFLKSQYRVRHITFSNVAAGYMFDEVYLQL